MVSNREERLDRLTNTWTEASAEVMISEYLKDTEHWGGDGLFFWRRQMEGQNFQKLL